MTRNRVKPFGVIVGNITTRGFTSFNADIQVGCKVIGELCMSVRVSIVDNRDIGVLGSQSIAQLVSQVVECAELTDYDAKGRKIIAIFRRRMALSNNPNARTIAAMPTCSTQCLKCDWSTNSICY